MLSNGANELLGKGIYTPEEARLMQDSTLGSLIDGYEQQAGSKSISS